MLTDPDVDWISQHLDSQITNNVRQWLSLPISTCVSETLSLPKSKGGFAIPSLKDTAKRMRLASRRSLQASTQDDMRALWRAITNENRQIDCIAQNTPKTSDALKLLKQSQECAAYSHVTSLVTQGVLVTAVTNTLSRSEVARWSDVTMGLSEVLFKFARKALMQQLPTASNLRRWGRGGDGNCRCGSPQTNKHVLSNCGLPNSLERYTRRHDAVLSVLTHWITSSLSATNSGTYKLLSDLEDGNSSVTDVFKSLRPDIVLVGNHNIVTLELTICHESNLLRSRQYKCDRYKDIALDLRNQYANF